MRPGWYINRLKTMSFPELFYRLKQVSRTKYYKYFKKGRGHRSVNYSGTNRILDQKEIDVVIEGFEFDPQFRIFDKQINILAIPDWHKDLSSGVSFSNTQFSRDINTRTHPDRSAKFVWEPARMQYLVRIAYAWRKTHEEKYLDLFIDHVESWIDQNPYLTGVHWYSNIELNIRLITWFLCWEILEIDTLYKEHIKLQAFIDKKWLPAIYLHCRHTVNNLSRFSSANNHLISEYAGLFIASSFWKFRESTRWVQLAKKGLESEILKQHTSEGINREETAGYIQFITDFFLVSYVVAEKTDNKFSPSFNVTFEKIIDYIFTLLDTGLNTPNYGDEDDGRAFQLETEKEFNNFCSILISGCILFKNKKWKSRAQAIDAKNSVLFGSIGRKAFAVLPEEEVKPSSMFYPESGHFFFKKLHNSKEVYIHFDAAPLGYLSIAAHGHADALSFTLHADGHPILVDPGTYSYHTHKAYRDYFKGTLAHNTLRINGTNQATIGGPTMWRDHYTVSLQDINVTQGKEYVKVSHNGYYSKFGILHFRTIEFDKQDAMLTITDDIENCRRDEEYRVEFPLHLHPEIKVLQENDCDFLLENKISVISVRIKTDKKLNYTCVKGSQEPLMGWYSHSFNRKTKTNTLYGKADFKGNQQFITQVEII